MKNPALNRAITVVGSQSELARKIGSTQQMVSFWLKKSKSGTPAQFCLAIEKATGGEVTCHDLRPDVYPAPERSSLRKAS
ncbi:MAG: helix-turn-helix domain-containing protein [Alphaproteobacteria bacterium]|nr:helix-turn-helix domain-containing protein [Alphaproteobacteria bacterium]